MKSSKRSLDLPVAGLAGLSAGFVVFSLPPDLLEGLVGATGIGGFVAAAQPPLGQTARIGMSIAAAAAAFALIFLLLRLIDRKPVRREPEEVEEEEAAPRRRTIVQAAEPKPQPAPEPEAEPEPAPAPAGLRLRRWDAHPDAPARRPIFAVSEIGEPEPTRSPLVTKSKKAEAPQTAAAPFWEPEDFPAADPEEAEGWMEEQEREPVREDQPAEASAPIPASPPEPEPKAEAEPEVPAAAQEPPVPQPAPLPPVQGNESIAELMARLERGLSRRQQTKAIEEAPSPEAEQAPAPTSFAAPGDERLRSAIDNLQRIAARGL